MYSKTEEFDIEIIKYLAEKGFVRRRELIADLIKTHKNESGYSTKSINRKLDSMVKQGKITILKYEDLKKFGIEEDDKRSSYVTLKKTEKITEHIDRVLENITSKNPVQQKMALKELDLYKKQHVLTPNQLDVLVSQLDIEDIAVVDNLLRIVYTYIDTRKIDTFSKHETINMLRLLLNKYPVPLKHYKSLRTHVIHLLGYFNDHTVIERLEQDAETLENLSDIIQDYESYYTANLIEDHREELYLFEEKLRLEGKKDSAQFVSNIRAKAMMHLGMYDDPFEPANSTEW